MEERKNIFDYVAQILAMYGFMMICMTCFTWLFGESAKEISALYVLGKEGIPLAVMLEILLLSIIITGIRFFFASDFFVKRVSIIANTFGMVVSIVVVMIVSIIAFKWFPINMWQPWVLFFLFFGICFILSIAVTIAKAKMEEKKLEEGLTRVKKQYERSNAKDGWEKEN